MNTEKITIERDETDNSVTYYINYGRYPQVVKVYVNRKDQRASFYSEGNISLNNLDMFLKAQKIAVRIIRSWEARWTKEAAWNWATAPVFALRVAFEDTYFWRKATGELRKMAELECEKTFLTLKSAVDYLEAKGKGGVVIVPMNLPYSK